MSHYGMKPMHIIAIKYKTYVVPIAIYVCQLYTYGMASMQVTLWGIVTLLIPWHNTTSLNTKPVSCVPLLALIPWYATTVSTIRNDTYYVPMYISVYDTTVITKIMAWTTVLYICNYSTMV